MTSRRRQGVREDAEAGAREILGGTDVPCKLAQHGLLHNALTWDGLQCTLCSYMIIHIQDVYITHQLEFLPVANLILANGTNWHMPQNTYLWEEFVELGSAHQDALAAIDAINLANGACQWSWPSTSRVTS